ncbi:MULTISPECIES: SRPBCC family protein [unclassified Plantactinospora]|uniref:SRPBCC family protein n=1 Tax=unclassified Plantactinospora TaxID=2631981 RepID=UPI000D158046|nr:MULTISPECIES: SRPBCC family protein [unclassified Plantactinospora]AVT31766.1 polyketide cyclase [Plantactinospora sp. BC1]AVT37923.1 polyketide cyclase [Plantactinospora sp. BB1]
MSENLTVTLPTDLEIKMVRVFEAPRALVFEAHAKCEHVKHWWGRGNPLDCEMDFRPGGSYRFVEHAPDGEYAFRGEYREIRAPERIVQTFEFEGMPGHVCVETLELTESDGRTTVTSVTRFDTKEERDAMAASGMAEGARESYEALAAYLPKLS